MTANENRKCPICGTRDPVPEGTQMLRCTLCKHTDSAPQFPQVSFVQDLIDDHAANNRAAVDRMVAMPPELGMDYGADIDNTGAAGEEIFSTRLDNNRMLTTFYPPDDVVAAVRKIDEYFRIRRGAKEWAFGPVQSRDDKHPNLNSVGLTGITGPDITLPVVKRLAAAFQCDVIKPMSAEGKDALVAAVLEYLDNGNDEGQHDAREIVDLVLQSARPQESLR